MYKQCRGDEKHVCTRNYILKAHEKPLLIKLMQKFKVIL